MKKKALEPVKYTPESLDLLITKEQAKLKRMQDKRHPALLTKIENQKQEQHLKDYVAWLRFNFFNILDGLVSPQEFSKSSGESKHWTKYLPEAGKQIVNAGDKLERLHIELQAQIEWVDTLSRELARTERDALEMAKNQWTAEEIKEAKLNSVSPSGKMLLTSFEYPNDLHTHTKN